MTSRPGSPKPPVPAPVRAVFLIGFMGAGKTSVGQALAALLGWRFEDLDDRIVAREGVSIADIFQKSGEAEFRRVEHAALAELLATPDAGPSVIALGGGAFVQADNARLVHALGAPTVFLDAPVEELWRRCREEAKQRPLGVDEQQFRRLYEARYPHYRKATARVETGGKTVAAVAAEIAAMLGIAWWQEENLP